jgi:hypothetical protein
VGKQSSKRAKKESDGVELKERKKKKKRDSSDA